MKAIETLQLPAPVQHPAQRINPRVDLDSWIAKLLLLLPFWLRRRRYIQQIDSQALIKLESTILDGLAGEDLRDQEFFATIAPDFTSNSREQVLDRGRLLEANLDIAAKVAVAEIRDELDIRTDQAQALASHLADLKNQEESIFEFPDFESLPSVDDLQERFLQEQKTRNFLSARTRKQLKIAMTLSCALVLVLFEAALVWLTLEPQFSGVSASTELLLPAQAVVVSMVLVWLGHRTRFSQTLTMRCTSLLALLLLVAALSGLRIGLVGADAADFGLETLFIASVVFLAAFGLALIGAEAMHLAGRQIEGEQAFQYLNADAIVQHSAALAARRAHSSNLANRRGLRQALQRSIPIEIHRVESHLLGEQAATRRLILRRTRAACAFRPK